MNDWDIADMECIMDDMIEMDENEEPFDNGWYPTPEEELAWSISRDCN